MKRQNSIKCNLGKETLKAIPSTITERKRFLHGHIMAFVGREFPCPALGGNVKVIKKSANETAFHASKSRRSTICALMLPAVIKNATLKGTSVPKKRTTDKGVLLQENPHARSSHRLLWGRKADRRRKGGRKLRGILHNAHKNRKTIASIVSQ